MKNMILALSLCLLPAGHAIGGIEECEFYARLSEELSCPNDGYLMRFGYRYCREFANKEENFTESGQVVLAKIRTCLVKALEKRTGLTCTNVKASAEEDHINCYLSSGFCGMSSSDKTKLAEIVWDEFEDPDFANVAQTINRRCEAGPQ